MNTALRSNLLSVLGVNLINYSSNEAVACLESLITTPGSETNDIFIINAHTLNLASDDDRYREVLNKASAVFGDGTGVRWAARLRGVRMQDNLVGTDLIPRLFESTANRGFSYFLLGADSDTIKKAAGVCQKKFPGWNQAGFHHGYILDDDSKNEKVISLINKLQPDVLLVGMGNPKQEVWIHENKHKLSVPACIGVGGLFDHWGGNLTRAPLWVRRLGYEWLQLLIQQPQKWRRYLVGNPKFIIRMLKTRKSDQARMAAEL
jgi:N-acetylglucosaminyldiphosphoundecaprenol N-acetyl-beta-D-mannosaminyltransferase